MDMKTEKIYKFERMYRTRVRHSQITMPVPTYIPTWDRYDPGKFEASYKTETIPALEFAVSVDDFEDIVDKLDQYSDTNKDWYEFQKCNDTYGPGWMHRMRRLESDKKREERLRQYNPALNKAWEQYQLLLKLCENQ